MEAPVDSLNCQVPAARGKGCLASQHDLVCNASEDLLERLGSAFPGARSDTR